VGCLNLAGFPFTAGFFSKDMILAEAFTTPGMAAVGWILLFTAGLTAYYTFRVFFRVFVGPQHFEPGDEVHGHDAHGHDDHGHDAHGQDAHGHGGHGHDAQGHDGHGDFHPHAPGWAINTVLAILTVSSLAAAAVYFVHTPAGHGGWVKGMVASSSAAYETPFHFAGHADKAEGHGEKAPAGGAQGGGHGGAYPPLFLQPEAVEVGAGAELQARAAGSFLGFNAHEVMYYVSGVVGAIGIGVAFLLHFLGRTAAATSRADALVPAFGGLARGAQHKWYVDEIYDFLIRTPLWVLSNIFHLFDKLVVDGLVNLLGWIPRAFGGTIRPSQSGVLHGYAAGMAGGLALVLLIALWVSFA
jgi:NADH-quinone oxidoreductase subunit L